MIPAAFDYVRADSADAAIAALVEHGDEAKLLAGGHSLLPLMKLRLAAPSVLVDIGRLSDLSYVRDGGDHVAIGGLTRHRDLETSDLLGTEAPLLAARGRPGRRPAGAPPRHHRRLDRARRPGLRPAGGAAGDAGHDRRAGPRRRAHHPGRRLLHRLPRDGAVAHRAAHRDPRAQGGGRRLVVPEAEPARPGLGDRRRGGRAERHHRHRAREHGVGAAASGGGGSRRPAAAPRPPTRPRSPTRAPSRARTSTPPPSSAATWRGCSCGGPWRSAPPPEQGKTSRSGRPPRRTDEGAAGHRLRGRVHRARQGRREAWCSRTGSARGTRRPGSPSPTC